MNLILTIEVPESAGGEQLKHELITTAYHRKGITLRTHDERMFDVDLVLVTEGASL